MKYVKSDSEANKTVTTCVLHFTGDGVEALCISNILYPGAVYSNRWFTRNTDSEKWIPCSVEQVRSKNLTPSTQNDVLARMLGRDKSW
jgi:hypothetical protein